MPDAALNDLELSLLLEAIVRSSGHDFTEYAQPVLKRRIAERMRAENVQTISGLQERILHDQGALSRFIFAMSSGHGGALFEDAAFFRALRIRIVPLLRTYSFTRIWIPGCGSGEDAYAIAAVLKEEGLLDRAMMYATDGSDLAVRAARTGSFKLDSVNETRAAHRATGAEISLLEHCDIVEDELRFHDDLKRNIIFAEHSVVSDGSLNEFHMIVARGLLRQFNRALQFRVHTLFLNSLVRLGFLCLGSGETTRLTPHENVLRRFDDEATVYRRMR